MAIVGNLKVHNRFNVPAAYILLTNVCYDKILNSLKASIYVFMTKEERNACTAVKTAFDVATATIDQLNKEIAELPIMDHRINTQEQIAEAQQVRLAKQQALLVAAKEQATKQAEFVNLNPLQVFELQVSPAKVADIVDNSATVNMVALYTYLKASDARFTNMSDDI